MDRRTEDKDRADRRTAAAALPRHEFDVANMASMDRAKAIHVGLHLPAQCLGWCSLDARQLTIRDVLAQYASVHVLIQKAILSGCADVVTVSWNPLTSMATVFLRSHNHRWSRTRGRHSQPFSQRVLRKCTMPFVLPNHRKGRHATASNSRGRASDSQTRADDKANMVTGVLEPNDSDVNKLSSKA